MERHAAAALDRYITREPDYDEERPALRCATCGVFLPDQPEFTREWFVLVRCSGEPKVIECTYGDGDEALLSIIGEEYRGTTYKVAYSAACGSKDGAHTEALDTAEIDPREAAEWKHEPHFYVEPWGWQKAAVRTCSRGHVNEEILL